MKTHIILLVLLACTSWFFPVDLFAQPANASAPQENAPKSPLRFNLRTKTIGGKQIWTDVRIQDGWHIQHNSYTKHFRLLDSKGYRHAWGTLDGCNAAFQRFLSEGSIQPYRKRVIILLHGILRSSSSMDQMEKYLQGRIAGSILNMTYASTRDSLEHQATALHSVLTYIPATCEISFVCHSMGNIVLRRCLHKWQDPRILRVVMLAPPNQGSALGNLFQDNQIFETVWGVSGQQLTTEFLQLKTNLAIPPCEFGILAGVYRNHIIQNRLLSGDNDLVLTVKETRLRGATDFRTIDSSHTRIMLQPTAQQYTYRYLQRGYFESAATRAPIK